MGKTKSWKDRLNSSNHPEVKTLTFKFAGLSPNTKMLVSTPKEINQWVRSIPQGETRTVSELKQALATGHGADAACPASTMIFLRIVAEVAWDELEEGADPKDVTPFWRIVEPESKLAKKLRCGTEYIARMRQFESGNPGI